MLKPRNLLFYVSVLLFCGIGVYAILAYGSHLRPAPAESAAATTIEVAPKPAGAPHAGFAQELVKNLQEPLPLLLDAATAGFQNDGDNETTGIHVSNGDPSVSGLLGTAVPNGGAWRWFFTQQHGRNQVFEILGDRDLR